MTSSPRPENRRFASVDALRGLAVAAMIVVNTPGDWSHLYAPLLHSEWHGFTPTDLVFPVFLFVVGVSIALAPGASARSILWRALRIVALGLVLHALAWWLMDTRAFRPWGVLQRIGICYAAAALLALSTEPRTQRFTIASLLVGYWALMLVALALGAVWSLAFPLNKNLWTSSFVLWTAGWSLLLLAAFHAAIDRHGWPAIGRRFGVNAIPVYAGAWVLECVLTHEGWNRAFADGCLRVFADPYGASLAYALTFVSYWWLVALVLDRGGLRLRI